EEYLEAENLLFYHVPELKEYDFTLPLTKLDEITFYSSLHANIYRASGRIAESERINISINETMLLDDRRKLSGVEYILIGNFGVGSLEDEHIIDYLEMSLDNGFLGDWRFHVMMNPVFEPLHNHPRYIALVKRFEDKMARQLALVNARELQHNNTQDKSL
ncbi:MAG: hypothetical protein OEY19_14105, partial [Gammaproteobacteria bacterium]|nr:hypothetical protein [Gammaproteobacteria bacterium]